MNLAYIFEGHSLEDLVYLNYKLNSKSLCWNQWKLRQSFSEKNQRGMLIQRKDFEFHYRQRNLLESNWNQIVFPIFRLIWNQTDVRLVQNQSENCKYNPISVWLNKILKRFLCVYALEFWAPKRAGWKCSCSQIEFNLKINSNHIHNMTI